ncbi:MAG: DUF4384 domain-containing protein, partial [Leptolyngbyaceae cyanobacterium bins.59]|nr:DUF4384 domain-containing protein [Leptolyngbyaceae cyanobacterium bins.59]
PSLIGQKSREQTLLTYYLPPEPVLGAEGVITAIEDDGKTGRLWLAGIPGNVLDYYGTNSVLILADRPPSNTETVPAPDGEASLAPFSLQLLSRTGLTAKVKVSGKGETSEKLQVGQCVQEWVRVLPRQVNLLVALDGNLERIERVDATSAFSGIAQIRSVPAGEQPADCLLGRINPPAPPSSESPTPTAEISPPAPVPPSDGPLPQPLNRYALFSVGHSLIPNTKGPSGEAVKVAIQRLVPSLRSLQATKLLRLTVNENSSRLAVGAVLEVVAPEPQQVMQRSTLRGTGTLLETSPPNGKPLRETGVVSLPIGSRIRYRLQNNSDHPVYFVLLGLDTSGSAIALYSGQAANSATSPDTRPTLKQEEIAAGETLTVPQISSAFEWVVREPAGIAETLILFSTLPFTQTLSTLESGLRQISNSQRIGVPSNPVEVAQAVLIDLHQASSGLPLTPTVAADFLALHMNAWATLSFVYQVV